MDRLPTTNVPGWLHPSLQGEVISGVDVPPHSFLTDTHTPVVISAEHALIHESSGIELTRVSRGHGRSFELGPNSDRTANRLGRVALWHDEFDNPYTSYSLKGNNFTYSTIMESVTAPSGYIPMGLLESDALLRVVRSSRLLREAGVSTEWINRVFEPQELLYKGEPVSQEEYKRRLLLDTANERGIEEMAKIAAAIEPMTFFITGRSMEINDRLADFSHDTPEQARKRLQRIFAVYNATHTEDDDFKHLQPARQEDRHRFFKKVFPRLLGENIAKLHNADLVHSFPTLSNVTILGGVIDLDSIKGVPLAMDDAPITAGDRANDIATITDYGDPALEIRELYKRVSNLGLISQAHYFLDAQNELVETYKAVRTPFPRKQDRLVERMAIEAANTYIAGTRPFAAYMDLSKRESRRALSEIWQGLRSIAEKGWSDENMAQEARNALDVRLSILTRELGPNGKIVLTKELLAPARKYFPLDTKNLLLEFHNHFPVLAEKIDEEMHLEKLRSYLPDKHARLRVLVSVMSAASRHVSQEALNEVGVEAIEQEISECVDKEIDAFLERVKPQDWQVASHHLDGFDVVKDVPANSVLVFEQKTRHSFEGVDMTSLIKSTLKAGIPVVTSERNRAFDPSYFVFPDDTLTARDVYSDGIGFKLTKLNIRDIDRQTLAAIYDTASPVPVSYVAMLCESTESDEYVLYIDATDRNAVNELVTQYKKTNNL